MPYFKLKIISKSMDAWINTIDSQIILGVAAIAVVILLLAVLVKMLQTSWKLLLSILVIGLVLHYVFGITPNQTWNEIVQLSQNLVNQTESIWSERLSQIID